MAVTTFEKGLQQGVQQGLQMAQTTFEKGLQQGLEQGVQQGLRTAVASMLEARFGPLSPGVRDRLEHLGPDRLEALPREALAASSLRELGLEE